MRIVSGSHKGRRLHPPKNLPVRPTTDFAKESLFNVLNNQFDFTEMKVLDLFSGTGSISLEFASRGCPQVDAVDMHAACLKFLREISGQFGFDGIQTIKADVFSFLERCKQPYDLIFADPPFDMPRKETIVELVFKHALLTENAWLIVEHGADTSFDTHPHFEQKRRYGHVNFSFFGMSVNE